MQELEDSRRTLQAEFEMKAQFVGANPKIHYDLGRAAMTRGPLVYCLEEADNGASVWMSWC